MDGRAAARLQERPQGPQCCPGEALRARWDGGVTEFAVWPPPSSSGRGRGSAWATGLCWREAEALAGTRPRALSEGVCHAIGNEGERLWRREDEVRQDEGDAAEARRPTRVRQETAANTPGRVVALPEQL